jgi:hypothetical protein
VASTYGPLTDPTIISLQAPRKNEAEQTLSFRGNVEIPQIDLSDLVKSSSHTLDLDVSNIYLVAILEYKVLYFFEEPGENLEGLKPLVIEILGGNTKQTLAKNGTEQTITIGWLSWPIPNMDQPTHGIIITSSSLLINGLYAKT